MELTLDQALQKGIEAHKAGKVEEVLLFFTIEKEDISYFPAWLVLTDTFYIRMEEVFSQAY